GKRPSVPDHRALPVPTRLPAARFRPGVGDRLDPVRRHRPRRASQLRGHARSAHRRREEDPHRTRGCPREAGSVMTAIITPPQAAASDPGDRQATAEDRRAKRRRFYERPGVLTYALLAAFFAGSAFPLWWSFVISSRQSSDTNLVPPAIIPGPNFLSNSLKVFDTVPFMLALLNSVIISGAITISVVF